MLCKERKEVAQFLHGELLLGATRLATLLLLVTTPATVTVARGAAAAAAAAASGALGLPGRLL